MPWAELIYALALAEERSLEVGELLVGLATDAHTTVANAFNGQKRI